MHFEASLKTLQILKQMLNFPNDRRQITYFGNVLSEFRQGCHGLPQHFSQWEFDQFCVESPIFFFKSRV